MQLIPPWAPNVHPMIVHFPIALVFLGLGTDVLYLVRGRRAVGTVAAWLYVLGAVSALSAYISGRMAAGEVFTPGMAHALVEDHEGWALATTLAVALLATFRLVAALMGRWETRVARLVFVALGCTAAVMVHQTAERGARLVYEQGVGVIPGPLPGGLGVTDEAPEERPTR